MGFKKTYWYIVKSHCVRFHLRTKTLFTFLLLVETVIAKKWEHWIFLVENNMVAYIYIDH